MAVTWYKVLFCIFAANDSSGGAFSCCQSPAEPFSASWSEQQLASFLTPFTRLQTQNKNGLIWSERLNFYLPLVPPSSLSDPLRSGIPFIPFRQLIFFLFLLSCSLWEEAHRAACPRLVCCCPLKSASPLTLVPDQSQITDDDIIGAPGEAGNLPNLILLTLRPSIRPSVSERKDVSGGNVGYSPSGGMCASAVLTLREMRDERWRWNRRCHDP